jgi:hypothetical protein
LNCLSICSVLSLSVSHSFFIWGVSGSIRLHKERWHPHWLISTFGENTSMPLPHTSTDWGLSMCPVLHRLAGLNNLSGLVSGKMELFAKAIWVLMIEHMTLKSLWTRSTGVNMSQKVRGKSQCICILVALCKRTRETGVGA